jgi:hypothetical protein
MSAIQEVWIVEGVEGTTRRQQKARLAEWKKQFVAEGASDIQIWEGGYGEYNGAWLFVINFADGAAWGALTDKYSANSKSFDDAMEVWQKTPVLKFRGGGLLHQASDI